MRVKPFKHNLVLAENAPDFVRSPGLHMSDIYNSLYKSIDPKRYNKRDEDGNPEELNRAKLEAGMGLELRLEPNIASVYGGCRPGELFTQHAATCSQYRTPVRNGLLLCHCGAGVAYSPDWLFDTPELILGEFKFTWYSMKNFPAEEKFDKWLCVTPETPILAADLRWVEAGSVKPGDWLIGFDETGRRRLKKTQVEAVKTLKKPCVRLELEDGIVNCSIDHQWLTQSPGVSNWRWTRTDELLACDGLRSTRRYDKPLMRWGTRTGGLSEYERGWLGGLFDGEGSLMQREKDWRFNLIVSQREGEVLNRARTLLRAASIHFIENTVESGFGSTVQNVRLTNTADILSLLSYIRPVRLLQKFASFDSLPALTAKRPTQVLSREAIGQREVVAIQTKAGTYIADGLASHNCQIKAYLYHLRLSKCWVFPYWVNGAYPRGGPPTPSFDDAYELEFRPKELLDNWSDLLRHAQRKGLIP